MPALLTIDSLHKTFGKGEQVVRAVNGVSFEVLRGECFGILGPNGAGKTTTIEMMEGLMAPDSGRILFEGQDVGGAHATEYARQIGIQFQHTALQDHMNLRQILALFQRLYAVGDTAHMREVLADCALEDLLDRPHKKLSGGQRQRLLLAIALLHAPKLVFLDEPTTGLDPQARRNFWALLQRIKAQGKTIVLTTHYMEEAAVLCDRIAIMDGGEIIAEGAPDALLREHFKSAVIALPMSEAAYHALQSAANNYASDYANGTARFYADAPGACLAWLQTASAHHAISLDDVSVTRPNLEDLFLKLTGNQLRA